MRQKHARTQSILPKNFSSGMGIFFKVQRCPLRAAGFEILSAARFSAAGVLALLRFAAAALRFAAAVLKNTCAAAQRCSGSSKTQALQRCAAAVQQSAAKSVEKA